MTLEYGLLNLYQILTALGLSFLLALIIGLSLKGMLANVGARMMLAIQRPFRVGDTINAGGATGRVEAIDLLSIQLVNTDNTTIHIPHASLFGGSISNFSARGTRRIDMLFGIGHDQDLEAAKDIIAEVISKDARILAKPSAQVDVVDCTDSSLYISARPWVCADDYWVVWLDTTEQVKKQFDAEEVRMTYPRREAHIGGEPAQQHRQSNWPHGGQVSSGAECLYGKKGVNG